MGHRYTVLVGVLAALIASGCPDPGQGHAPDGHAPDGHAADASRLDVQGADAGLPDGHTADARLPDGYTADARLPDGHAADGRRPDGHTADARLPDVQTADAHLPDGGTTDGFAACDPAAPGIGLPVHGSVPSFTALVGEARPVFRALSQAGLAWYPDMPATLVPSGAGGLDAYVSAQSATRRLRGTSLENLALSPSQPVLTSTGITTDRDEKYVGSGGVVDCGGQRVMFYHGENHFLVQDLLPSCAPMGYVATMNRAVSVDNGASFVRDEPGTVVSPAATSSYSSFQCAYGAGGGTTFASGPYLFMYYFDWSVNGLHLARACRSDCGAVGSWRKYNQGAFGSAPANAASGPPDAPSGPSSAVVPVTSTQFDAFVTVSYNSYLGAYLMVSATESGFALHASADGVSWGSRLSLLQTIDAAGVKINVYYPALFDASTLSRDETGRNMLLIYGAEMDDSGQKAPHVGYVTAIELTRAGDTASASGLLDLKRYSGPAGHWLTTGQPPTGQGYVLEGVIAKLAANTLPGTHPLFECRLASGAQMLSIHSNCEGQTNIRLTGFAASAAFAGGQALYRCTTPGGDRFASLDASCEGVTVEGVLGYVLP